MASFREIIDQNIPVLVDFHATWCGPCQVMSPILEEVKKELGEDIKVIKIDIDRNQKLASQLGVRGVPTFILYKNGKQLWRQSGIISKNELLDRISQSHSNVM